MDFPNLKNNAGFEKFVEGWNSPRKLLSIVIMPTFHCFHNLLKSLVY